MSYPAAVITVSDRSFRGERQDLSGPAVARVLHDAGFRIVLTRIVPDEREAITDCLLEACKDAVLVVTTGGTGISPRDVTPEATQAICDRIVPGIAETMRAEGSKHTPMAALSRGLCGTRGKSVILNLPGSPVGATQSLGFVVHLLPHALELLQGNGESTLHK